jgi:hypothetical protein
MAQRRYWTGEQDAMLLRMRSDGVPHADIADALGDRTESACVKRMDKLNRRAASAASGEKPKAAPRPFSDEDVATLLRMRDVEGREFSEIDAALGRNPGVSCQKYRQIKGLQAPPRRMDEVRNADVPAECVADRDERFALSHASITSAFFGDPLPGRSALDLRSPRHHSTEGKSHASHY